MLLLFEPCIHREPIDGKRIGVPIYADLNRGRQVAIENACDMARAPLFVSIPNASAQLEATYSCACPFFAVELLQLRFPLSIERSIAVSPVPRNKSTWLWSNFHVPAYATISESQRPHTEPCHAEQLPKPQLYLSPNHRRLTVCSFFSSDSESRASRLHVCFLGERTTPRILQVFERCFVLRAHRNRSIATAMARTHPRTDVLEPRNGIKTLASFATLGCGRSCPFRFRSPLPHMAPNEKLRRIGKYLVRLGRTPFGIDKICCFKTPHVFRENGQLRRNVSGAHKETL
jgi:hypothetical protein